MACLLFRMRRQGPVLIGAAYLLYAFGAAAGVGSVHGKPNADRQNDVMWENSSSGIRVALFRTPLQLCNRWKTPPSLEDVSRIQRFAVAINGTYFKGTYAHARPAGLFRLDGKDEETLSTDRQLTRIVIYDSAENRLTFLKASGADISHLPPKGFAFQTGPQILVNNIVQDTEIAGSHNGSGRFLRTVLGKTNCGEFFFAITTKPLLLTELGKQLTGMHIFHHRILSVVNLDGGPSVALCAPARSSENTNAAMHLPLVIGTRTSVKLRK